MSTQTAEPQTSDHAVVSREEWLKARKELLDEEKKFTHHRDALSAKRRELPFRQ